MENSIDITLYIINIVSILWLLYYKYAKKTNPNILFFQGLLTVMCLFILYLLFMAVVTKPEEAIFFAVVLVYQAIYFPFVALIMFLISLANNKTWILSNKRIVCCYALFLLIFIILDVYWIIMAQF